LPADLSLELLTISGEALNGREGDIRFNPDGSSTGGRISLADGPRRIDVGVDWLTGRVSVADER
jgi:general secretion pathway protein H